jgi:phosphohistidine swiveling domain-containing protein
VYAALTPEDFAGEGWRRLLPFLLIEQYLVDADDGWIFRGARYYRGALQADGEAAAAEQILHSLAAESDWIGDRLPLLVEAVRLFPTETEPISAGRVRALATAIHAAAPEFGELRNKLHNRLDPGDAAAVRAFAERHETGAAAEDLAALAESIDALFRTPPPALLIRSVTPLGPAGVRLREIADDLATAGPRKSVGLLADAMAVLRDSLPSQQTPAARVRAIRAILALETGLFALVPEVLAEGEQEARSRLAQLGLMASLARAAYGLGLLTPWERSHFDRVLRDLDIEPTLDEWRDAVGYFERIPGWAQRRLALYLELPLGEFARLEPRALEYLPDRLRGSPLAGYARAVEALAHDAAVLAGVRHEFLGERVTVGFRALNPGLARGVVRTLADLAGEGEVPAPVPRDSIVVVPETLAELPAVAGILTENEGNMLSHVQLLARNLGVPNVVVGAELVPRLLEQRGRRIELAVSPGGLVRITALEAEAAPRDLPPEARQAIVPDLAKLDLDTQRVLSTRELGAGDSGVRVGPKAAQVGQLTAVFPERVSPGLAIPFGVYRDFLAQPRFPGDADTISAFDWLRWRYAELDAMPDASRRMEETRLFLAEFREWLAAAPLDAVFVERLRDALEEEFGPDGSYGVFVRSDTNVEDLPGFTGAGLNLTVPHVVGFDNILAAIRAVWASPFTERAFGWRQALMDAPEHVYASVLLHLSVPNERSGVLVTADAATGARGFLSVATHEGVAGGVEGQSAETLRIRVGPKGEDPADTPADPPAETQTDPPADGPVEIRLLSSATAPLKRVLLEAGGSALVPASGRARVLSDADIAALVALSRELPGWFTDLPEAAREATVADVEFGFHRDRLMLFQIRPFVENRSAERVVMLQAMDRVLRDVGGERISLAEPTR